MNDTTLKVFCVIMTLAIIHGLWSGYMTMSPFKAVLAITALVMALVAWRRCNRKGPQ